MIRLHWLVRLSDLRLRHELLLLLKYRLLIVQSVLLELLLLLLLVKKLLLSQELSLRVQERGWTWKIRCLLSDHWTKKEWITIHHILEGRSAHLHLLIINLVLKEHLIEKLGLKELLEVHYSRNKRILLVRDLWTRMLLSWKMKLNIDVLKLVDDLWRLRSTVIFDSSFISLRLLAIPLHLWSI